MSETSARAAPVRVWDLPVRLVHWLLLPLIAFSWWSAEEGRLDWHRLSGYSVLGLVLFRILWGLVGSQTARLAPLLAGPGAISRYFKKAGLETRAPVVGHNPLGGWSVLAMLALLAAQTVLGLFAVDVDGIESGPLAVFVSFETGRVAAAIHEITFNVILGLVVLHVGAIAYYAVFKRDNLVGPMITGRKALAGVAAPKLAPLWLAIILAIMAGGVVYAVTKSFWAF
jgi:cytochrome b